MVDAGYRLRIYMPYGELIPGMAYLVRRLLENTSNDSFLRASFAEHVSPEVLLMNPLEHPEALRGEETIEGDGKMDQLGISHPKPESTIQSSTAAPMADLPAFRNEPPADFAQEENRQAMREALAGVRAQFGRSYPLVIDGEAVETRSEIVSRNPSDLAQSVGNVAAAEPQHAQRRSPPRSRHCPSGAWPPHGAGPSICSRPPRSCAAGGSSWPPGKCTNAARGGAKPTPTCARRSTFASTTPAARSRWSAGEKSTCRARRIASSTCRAAWRPSSHRGIFRWRFSPA